MLTGPVDRKRFLQLAGAGYAAALGLAGGAYGLVEWLGGDGEASEDAGRALSFRSRPDLRPPEVTTTKDGAAVREYLFLAPMGGPGQRGPLIVDADGEPVWFLPNRVKGKALMNFAPAVYRGEQVLTWFDGSVEKGHGFGDYVIADASYREIARVRAHGQVRADLHELRLTPEGTALVATYDEVPADLTAVGGPRRGRAYENVVQEIDVESGELLFEWRSLDHVGIAESHRELTAKAPYDYLHANSIDVGPDGSLLLSGRHTWALYAIERPSGKVRWRLGGKKSDFELAPDVRFAWQHDARWQGHGTITLFDNGAEPKVEDHSSGLVLDVDETAMRVSLARSFAHPQRYLAIAMGSMQPLPDLGACVGWGTVPAATVFGADGGLRLDARLPEGAISYRAYLDRWEGRPAESPALAVEPGPVVHVSWNGATRVARWRVRTGSSADALRTVATAERSGFETSIPVDSLGRFVAVDALARDGRTLDTAGPIAVQA